jgi:hypothetical protein
MDNEEIVREVIRFTRRAFSDEKTLDQAKKSKRQFQDLINAAGQATSIEEFKLYIAYKAAKASNNDLWKSFGRPLNRFIDELIKLEPSNDISKKLEVLHQGMGYLMQAAYAEAEGELDYV